MFASGAAQGSASPTSSGWSRVPRPRAGRRASASCSRRSTSLHRERDLDDATWTSVRGHLDERESIELCMLVGHYEMLATAIATLRIQTDSPRR